MKFLHSVIATFFGAGKIPGAPGTWGSIAAIPCFYFLLDKPWVHLAVLVAVYFLGVYAAGKLEQDMGEKDPSCVVIDEVLGMGVAMWAVPHQGPFLLGVNTYVIAAFVLFRIFDIWKPYPIRRLEKFSGGWGVMTDDLAAGIYAFIWVQIGIWLTHLL